MNSTDLHEADARTTDDPDGGTDERTDRLELAARVELLTEENRRLRDEYARARQSRYRRTALGLSALGLVAAAAGFLFPDGRDVLFALAATGLFGGLLTYYVAPERFVAADVGERVYAATAANEAAIADELGLRDEQLYVPHGESDARLYVPQHAEYELPDDLEAPIVTDEASRGLVLEATGAGLFREFERSLTGDLADSPAALAAQQTDGLVEGLELAGSATPDVEGDAAAGRLTVAITDGVFGPLDRFDHPIASFLAVGVAVGLEQPVTLEVTRGDERADWLVTCRWSDRTDVSDEANGSTGANEST